MNTTVLQTRPDAGIGKSAAEIAAELAPAFAASAAQHDAADSFVAENFQRLKAAGLAAIAVPSELGGGGASLPELCEMLRVIARSCGSTALAFAMHTHQVAIPAWRWQHTPATRPAVEPLLRRVADEGLILLSSGGADWVGGSGTAKKVDGGYKINARKSIISGAPLGDLLVTGAVADEVDGPVVIHFAAPMAAPEVHLLDTWHTLGMRGTGSHDIDLAELFIPDAKVALKRKAGEWHPLFQIIATIAFPLIYAAYLGVAESARDIAVGIAAKRAASGRTTRIAGQMDTHLRATQLAHRSMVEAATRNQPSEDSVNEVMIGRRLVEEQAIRSVELAMELAGGAGFYRAAGLERRFRDIQGARYHPMTREAQYEYAGARALGLPVSRIY
jgi:alkylation response protein AidB-like acyl-CoA dehydrogenase